MCEICCGIEIAVLEMVGVVEVVAVTSSSADCENLWLEVKQDDLTYMNGERRLLRGFGVNDSTWSDDIIRFLSKPVTLIGFRE